MRTGIPYGSSRLCPEFNLNRMWSSQGSHTIEDGTVGSGFNLLTFQGVSQQFGTEGSPSATFTPAVLTDLPLASPKTFAPVESTTTWTRLVGFGHKDAFEPLLPTAQSGLIRGL
jgi:hypothetical protein